ncbi:hypothetical protein KW782_00400 [Candidatus Parcubacteria bacterium]|nr:hypothetical protein [Candidatus Parcubacteria bacterium]
MLRLRGMPVGRVWSASGARGFLGKGYWYHPVLRTVLLGQYGFKGSVFTARTTTLEPRKGNMPFLRDGITPRDLLPRCIYVNPIHNFALNAVGLSGPGAEELFRRRQWNVAAEYGQMMFLSFMAVEKTREARLEELRQFVKLADWYLGESVPYVGLQINVSCPNVGLHFDPKELVDEVHEMLAIANVLGIPLVVKTDPLFDPEALCAIARSPYCDAVTPSNTIPFAKLPEETRYKLFSNGVSPLWRYGGGGCSGEPCLELSLNNIWMLKILRISKPVFAGNGITHPDHVGQFKDVGADGISVGAAAFLRPHNLQRIIQRGNYVFS